MQKDANFKHTNINTHKTKGWKKSPVLPLYFSGSRFQWVAASVSSAKVMEHACANREHRERATNCGIGVVAIHTDKMHYYLCTLINGESKLSINHVCPRGWKTGGADRVERSEEARMWAITAPGLEFLRTKTQIWSCFVTFHGVQTLVEGCLHQHHVWMGHTDIDLYTNKYRVTQKMSSLICISNLCMW